MFAELIEISIDEVELNSTLAELGIDSLLVTELQGEIQKRFNVDISTAELLQMDSVLAVCDRINPDTIARPRHTNQVEAQSSSKVPSSNSYATETRISTGHEREVSIDLAVTSQQSFSKVKNAFDQQAEITKFSNFRTNAFLLQSKLVVQYVVEAFNSLGCNISALKAGDKVPLVLHIQTHSKVVPQLYKILQAANLIREEHGSTYYRTATAVSTTSSSSLHAAMLQQFPQHTSETQLLHTTGRRLADCLSGKADPVGLIFRDSVARALLGDVYLNAPMFKAGTMVLAQYLGEILARMGGKRELNILELGAGTGGTTSYLLETLVRGNDKFKYTFTDLSSSLVMAAKRKFAKYSFMHYAVVDIEKTPESQFLGQYDIVISTNCIHATKDLILSTTNIRKMLRPDGILCLVELTRNLFWFDLVFGLLEGWWLFNDGRKHVLVDEARWQHCLSAAGFEWIDWSDSPSEESDILRVVTASPSARNKSMLLTSGNQDLQETVVFKKVDDLELFADIYYPSEATDPNKKLPVGENRLYGGENSSGYC